jgi:predicted PurR-regulated permease PerM
MTDSLYKGRTKSQTAAGMTIGSSRTAYWVGSTLGIIALLIVGRQLLVPFAFALLLWAILNALTDALRRLRLPAWLAWIGSLSFISLAIYLVVRTIVHDAVAFAEKAPDYFSSLEHLLSSWLTFLQLGPIDNLISRADIARILGPAASKLGIIVFGVLQVLIYVGFLLLEQRSLPAKFAQLRMSAARDGERDRVFRTIARQVQSYLGVCTIFSLIMSATCYTVLTIVGADFAGFWALAIFFLTYIPAVGAVSVAFPALMALAQFEALGPAFIIVGVLAGVHTFLFNLVQPLLLGRSLDLSPLAIILSLTFWGLLWGVAGLFLAVPIMAAVAIVCRHIEGLNWAAVLLAAPPSHRAPATAREAAAG